MLRGRGRLPDNTASESTGVRQHRSSAGPTINEFRGLLFVFDAACSLMGVYVGAHWSGPTRAGAEPPRCGRVRERARRAEKPARQ
eukprot:5281159-Pyramimonas_sp.AAC.1